MFNIITDINGKREVVKTFNDYFEACDYMNANIYGRGNCQPKAPLPMA